MLNNMRKQNNNFGVSEGDEGKQSEEDHKYAGKRRAQQRRKLRERSGTHGLCYNGTGLSVSCSGSGRQQPMATIEERLQALEQEHTTLKKTIELQTIAIGALVTKATLEKLNEKYDKLFETLITHDNFTNEQLADLRNQNIELDGKIVGLRTETRQRLTELDNKIVGLDSRVINLQTTQLEHTTRLDRVETLLIKILDRLPEK